VGGELRIGSVRLAHPFIQAALSGYSDLAMRRIARMHGASYALNEVVLDRSVNQKGRLRDRVLHVASDDHPVGGQLMGSCPDDFAPAARALADAGYDVIDINFGCPVRKVLGRCRGGYLLSQPAAALEIVARVLDAVGRDKPVTVKMRRGMDLSAQSERDFFAILDGAFSLGVAGVTVHGRTVAQRYVGPSCWDFLSRVKRFAGQRVVLGSGDLFSAEACIAMMERTGVDGVTIARGAIGNPWIFSACLALSSGAGRVDPPTVAAQRRTLAAHFDESVRVHGAALAGRLMRKFGIKYSELHPGGCAVRDAFIAVKTPVDFNDVLERWYNHDRGRLRVVGRRGPGDLVAAGAT